MNAIIELSECQKSEMTRAVEMAAAPSTHLKPRLFPDEGRWCALYGEDLQTGVCGFGKTPEGAMADFDHNFRTQTCYPKNIANMKCETCGGVKSVNAFTTDDCTACFNQKAVCELKELLRSTLQYLPMRYEDGTTPSLRSKIDLALKD